MFIIGTSIKVLKMAEICAVCGLPSDLCICEEMSKEDQRVKIRLERRRWGKKYTVIDGIDSKNVDLDNLATKLKNKCACGGNAKNDQVLLMGDHRGVVYETLIESGFPKDNIEIQ
jgi:translation initiation factor 1